MKDSIVIRAAIEADAEEMLIYLDSLLLDSPNNLTMSPLDPKLSTEDERLYIRSLAPPSYLLVAMDGNYLVGTLGLSRIEKQRRNRRKAGIPSARNW